jgi:hypothetical protein
MREDLERISTAIRSSKDMALLERDEHARYQFYIEALSVVTPENERQLIEALLRDPDRAMKTAAIVDQVDRKGASLPTAEQFATWEGTFHDLVDEYPFVVRRIEEWQLFKQISEDDVSKLSALPDASDWLQRKVAEESSSQPTLELLAEAGRTKRVRNMANQRLAHLKRY